MRGGTRAPRRGLQLMLSYHAFYFCRRGVVVLTVCLGVQTVVVTTATVVRRVWESQGSTEGNVIKA